MRCCGSGVSGTGEEDAKTPRGDRVVAVYYEVRHLWLEVALGGMAV